MGKTLTKSKQNNRDEEKIKQVATVQFFLKLGANLNSEKPRKNGPPGRL